MKFAVYDLDQTLLPVDSCETWNSWLVHRAGMDEEAVERRNREFYDAYEKGTFDIDAFETFILGLLAKCRRSDLDRWMDEYLDAVIRPAVRPEALELVKKSESEGYVNVLATGTHRFISQPIAGLFGFRHLVAATPEVTAEGEFTGRLVGGHSFAEGKLRMVREFVDGYAARAGEKPERVDAYSDSINDLPLLSWASERGTAWAVNPSAALRREAERRGWQVMKIF
jgi:HAD superfamily hydrolase (TIGR01490 family)